MDNHETVASYLTMPSNCAEGDFVDIILPADTLVVAGPSLDEDSEHGKWQRLEDGRIQARMTILELRWCLALTAAVEFDMISERTQSLRVPEQRRLWG